MNGLLGPDVSVTTSFNDSALLVFKIQISANRVSILSGLSPLKADRDISEVFRVFHNKFLGLQKLILLFLGLRL